MGSELVSDSPPLYGEELVNNSSSISYSEQFYNHLPFYLAIGMPFDLYWDGDCCLAEYYRQAYELKKKERNQELWLQGMYIYESLCDVAPILRAFASKGAKPTPYVSEPYPLSHKEIVERKEREEKARLNKMKAKMLAFVKQTNSSFEGKKRKEGCSDG